MATANFGKTLHRLKIVNLPWTIGDNQLKQFFSKFGYISNAKVIFDRNTGLSKHIGFIDVTDSNTANEILNNKSYHLEGLEIYVHKYIDS